MLKSLYFFQDRLKDSESQFGSKGAGLVSMHRLGLPVPAGFIITTQTCRFFQTHQRFPGSFRKELLGALRRLEEETGKLLGDPNNPLILAVRGSLPASTPGMAKRILNVGLTKGMVGKASVRDLTNLWERFKKAYSTLSNDAPIPADPWQQIEKTIEAIIRTAEGQSTAVVVQVMVFGNRDQDSLTGVAFSRDPISGAKKLSGEYLERAQGNELVDGGRTPHPLSKLSSEAPQLYRGLQRMADILETENQRIEEIEFTVESGKLYLLDHREALVSAKAKFSFLKELIGARKFSPRKALLEVRPQDFEGLLYPQLDVKAAGKAAVICRGLTASPTSASGQVVSTPERAKELARQGLPLILVRNELSQRDLLALPFVQGLMAFHGGTTAHAAVVARGEGKACVMSCEGKQPKEGEWITIDGASGVVYAGQLPIRSTPDYGLIESVLKWGGRLRQGIHVRANADTGAEAKLARKLGAEGIGLARTEHMFFGEERLTKVQSMIIADTKLDREKILKELLTFQRRDFGDLFCAMEGLPVTIRLLDPPLHEFLPKALQDLQLLAKELKVSVHKVEELVQKIQERNPMLGHRGARLGITHPEIYAMQVRAMIQAALAVKKQGIRTKLEIEIPLIAELNELLWLRKLIDQVAHTVDPKNTIKYQVGTMIELPRACMIADQLAKHADFFSFGTNDLTQMTLGLSRDDSGQFLPAYLDQKIFPNDPFVVLDREGVGQLMRECVKRARRVKPKMEIGICGEHGGEPSSIEFCAQLGLDYVSCSPYRVPVARLVAAKLT